MAGPTVIIGCKLPNGLIIEVAKTRVLLNGSNTSAIAGGYGLTSVDASFADQFFKERAGDPLIVKGIIFRQEKEVNAKAQAEDTKTVETGLEPMAQGKPEPGISQGVPLDPGQAIEKFDPKK